MKTVLGVLVLMAVLAGYLAQDGCATWRQKQHDEWVKACGPQVPAVKKPCSCFDPTTPGCPPVPSDATRKDGGAQ